MKRFFVALSASVVLAAPAAAQSAPASAASPAPVATAAAPAIAFDQVDIVSMGAYVSSPGDFAKESAAVEALAAQRAANPGTAPAFTIPTKTLTRRAYWHGRMRVENVLAHTIVITKPGEIDTLDTLKKTYRQRLTAATPADPPAAFPFPLGPTPGQMKPGTIDISLSLDGGAAQPVTIDGRAANAYSLSLFVDAGEVSGSCGPLAHFFGVKATIEQDVLDRAEPPATAAATPGAIPFISPEAFAKLPFFNPAGCALHALTVRMTNLPNIVAFADFYLYRRMEIKPAAGSGIPFLPTIISERGNLRDLTDADAALFDVPADYTLVP